MSPRKKKDQRPLPGKAAAAALPGQTGAGEPTAPQGGKAAILFWGSGLLLAVCGYFFLTRADAAGQNFWAWAAPACLLAGYLLFIPAIIFTYRR